MAPVAVQDDIRVKGDVSEPKEDETQSSKSIIGIIHPPPEVRNIVDKTASFVCRNGAAFEAKIRLNEQNNQKFNFLSDTDPYHAYYRHKLNEFMEGKGIEPVAAPQPVAAPTKPAAVQVALEKLQLKDPPAEYEYIADPPSISAFDLDIVRLTALFAAKNGRTFINHIMNKEARSNQFDFLRPQHSLYTYFTKMVEQYNKVLIPQKSSLEKLKKEIENPKIILEDVEYRVEWARHEARQKEKELAAAEKERQMYAQIDWHDFVVVETVDFFAEEQGNFPAPVTIDELGARLLQQERIEKYGEESLQNSEKEKGAAMEEEAEDNEDENVTSSSIPFKRQDMDMEESDEEEEAFVMPQLHLQKPPNQSKIIKDYDPKKQKQANRQQDETYVISPFTQEKVKASDLQKHVKYQLIDPNWKDEREKQIQQKKAEDEVYAAGSDISASLRDLADRRTDIFGVEETAIGKKVGETEKDQASNSVQWDGHSGSGREAQRLASSKVTAEEQIEYTKKTLGLLTDEKLEKIGPKTDEQDNKSNTQVSTSNVVVQQLRAAPILQPLMVVNQPPAPRPVILVQQPVMRPPQPQLIAVQRPTMVMSHPMVRTPMQMQPLSGMQQIIQQQTNMGQQEGPPPSKRSRTEGDLIPADAFNQQHPGPVQFFVQCPTMPEKTEWKLQGQRLQFKLPLTDEVSVIKALIHEETKMPAGKQKLQLDGLFIKDNNTLAFYNMMQGNIVVLQVKERGGRRR